MELENIRNIFSLKKGKNHPQTDSSQMLSDNKQQGENYNQYGFRMAGRSEGALNAFTPCLQSVYLGLKREQEADEQLQQDLKVSLQNKKANLERNKEQEENNKQAEADTQKELDNDIAEKQRELSGVRNESYQRNRSAWNTLVISSIILVPFTLYFFIFYSSVAYSAFFKQFSLESLGSGGDFKLAEAIFDSQALTNALHDSTATLLFILLMPIIFLAFGFVLNRWEQETGWLKWIKIPLIILVAFVFDALLSYEICEKIYNLHTQMSLESLPEYSIRAAANDPHFWVIICLGFVSYLVWGITFGYFVKSLDKLDLNKIRQEHIANEITMLKERRDVCIARQNSLANNIAGLKAEIQTIENQLNGTIARYDVTKIKVELNNFHAGWQLYMNGMEKSSDERDAITHEFENTLKTLITI